MIKARMEGADQIARKLRQLAKSLSAEEIVTALLEAAEPIRSRAASLAPRSPVAPHLTDNMVVEALETGEEPMVGVGPSKQVPYGGFVELGTRDMAAQPYLRPAFEQNISIALASVGQRLWNVLKGAV